MQNLVPALLPRLAEHHLDGLDAGSDAFYPYYEGYSLLNLPASICHWLGAPPFGAGPLGPELLNAWQQKFRHVIFLLVDGFGLNAVQSALEFAESDPAYVVWKELSQEAVLAPITSIAPSTTAAALTTLWTGCPPSEHGVVAYEVWLKEYSMIANMILHEPASYYGDVGSLKKAGFDPETFLPVKTLGPHLLKNGVKSYAFQHQAIAHSGLSQMLFPGVQVMPFRSLGDLWVTLAELMEVKSSEQNYIYIYWGDLDELSHRFGPQDERVRREFLNLSLQLRQFIRQLRQQSNRQDTLFVMSADHGHIYTPPNPDFEVRNHPEMLDCLVMYPSGEARMPFVYLRPGREEQFLAYLEKTWPGVFHMIPSEQAVRSGLFGSKVYSRFPERVGDYIIIPQDNAYWWFAPNRDNPLNGRHGGLSATEMLSPFFAFAV